MSVKQRGAESSQYINDLRHGYSVYVMQQRAIPSVSDGLKAAARRVLWTARDGKKVKSATLAGATMPIHPHSAPEGAVNTLAAHYGNNIPLLKGYSAFGTLLEPTEYSASRYTTVSVSKFTQDVVFADLNIIPMQDNYDGTLQEPVHFLPLVPIVLLNPTEGIAVGFAANILPRDLGDIIDVQIAHLRGKKTDNLMMPYFAPLDCASKDERLTAKGRSYVFTGSCVKTGASSVVINKLPYGLTHTSITDHLNKLVENGTITDYVDGSKDTIAITVTFPRGQLKSYSDDQLVSLLGLEVRLSENLNVLNFQGTSVWNPSPHDLVRKFTDWRLGWYTTRYETLRSARQVDAQRCRDILTAIANNIGGISRQTASRSELRELLTALGIVHDEYIADLPVYRFTEEEARKTQHKLDEILQEISWYDQLLSSEDLRKQQYVKELKNILDTYVKGGYDERV